MTVKVSYKGKSIIQKITIRNTGSTTSNKSVRSISLQGCSSTLNEASRCAIKARVKYSDGSSQYIYPSTSGASFSENSRYAYISGKYLRIKSVNRNEKVTVKVRYKGKSATQRITIRNNGSTTGNKSVRSISLKGCPSSMDEGYRCQIKARVKYSDGSSKYIYPSTSGASFSENSRYAYINGKYLSFRSVRSNKRVTVKVRYKGKTATKQMTIRNR